MDKNAIKKYAVWARRELISRVSQKALQYGIAEDNIVPASAASVNGVVLSVDEIKQRKALIEKINKEGYHLVCEEVAYTWFNRFIALRFMEVNGYLPSRVRVFTDDENNFKPQILTEAINMDLEGLDMGKVYALKNANDDDALFKYLIIVQCNALSGILPGMFQRISDYTELLFPDNLLREGSVIQQMIAMIPEDNWTDQVQIIGWLYQYYNTEPKDKVFADLKKNIKITKENIPAATQLFTPDWIVRYMVENSLGRLWLEGHPDAKEQMLPTEEERSVYASGNRDPKDTQWHYYLEEAQQEPDVQAQLAEIRKEYAALKPEDIKCIDPCMGSGHILCYLFDVLVRIYEDYGYTPREAVSSIVEKNLWGLDIDQRAAQLAYFAVMMKARQYDRRFLSRKNADGYPDVPQPHVYAIAESNGIDPNAIAEFVSGDPALKKAMDSILKEMQDAKEYGSILNITPVDFDALYTRFDQVYDEFGLSRETILNELLPLVRVAETLARKYDVVVTNPPYMASSGMSASLNNYLKEKYPLSKGDLFAVFIERCIEMAKKNHCAALITQQSWMFLSSYEKLREKLSTIDVGNILHLGAHAFEEQGGEVVQTVAFTLRKTHISGYVSTCDRLVSIDNAAGKEKAFLDSQYRMTSRKADYELIPAKPYAYWISKEALNNFQNKNLGSFAEIVSGMTTGNNDIFLREWTELDYTKIAFDEREVKDIDLAKTKWIPYHKGGEMRKWYGNHEYVVNWSRSGEFNRAKTTMTHVYLKPCITWSDISGNSFAGRYCYGGFMFDVKGSCAFAPEDRLKLLIGIFNSKVTPIYVEALNPTTTTQVGDLKRIPLITPNLSTTARIEELVMECVCLSQADWDSFETSWDFQCHPLIAIIPKGGSFFGRGKIYLSECYQLWKYECLERFNQLKANEEKLNRIFIDIYGLQNELTPEVEDKDVTVRKADLGRDIRSLISYAVGCMFGRYSLDALGLILAGQKFSEKFAYASVSMTGERIAGDDGFGGEQGDCYLISENGTEKKVVPCTFAPDQDNIIPICDDEYFEDDIVGRFIKFIEVVYGKDTLDENLRFIADALGGKGQPKDVIRNYFLNDFYADHLKTYQKRPIYWLFDSGKKNGFKCLIYMHRYQPDTIARIRTDYVHEQQSRYRTAIADLEQRIQGASTDQRVKLTKQLQKIQAQAEEVRVYEERIHHLADQYISIDLDDGVKKNYEIFKDVLAKIK